MIFKVKLDEDIRKTNDGIDSIPAFVDANDKTIKYVILMYDYDSPYARQPHDVRKQQVLLALDYRKQGSIDSFFSRNRKKIKDCEEAYAELQYDDIYEGLLSCKTQLRNWDKLLRNEEKTDKEEALAFKIFDKYPQLMEKIEEMEKIVGYREKYDKTSTADKRTALEKYIQSNSKR